VVFLPFKNSVRMVIVPSAEKAFGFLQGMDTTVERDEEERL
jgi:hypothetical protein